jgi:hypothetical protein
VDHRLHRDHLAEISSHRMEAPSYCLADPTTLDPSPQEPAARRPRARRPLTLWQKPRPRRGRRSLSDTACRLPARASGLCARRTGLDAQKLRLRRPRRPRALVIPMAPDDLPLPINPLPRNGRADGHQPGPKRDKGNCGSPAEREQSLASWCVGRSWRLERVSVYASRCHPRTLRSTAPETTVLDDGFVGGEQLDQVREAADGLSQRSLGRERGPRKRRGADRPPVTARLPVLCQPSA